MALAPADFYAFSRATGIPVPETPEEQVQLAPQVLEFRRNQLRAPKEESNPLAAVGAAALGLGALAGLGFGARRFLARNADIPKGPAKSATAGVRQVNLSDFEAPVRRAAEPLPSKIASRSVMPTEEESFAQYTRELQSKIPEPTAQELTFPPATSRTYGAEFREKQGEPGYRSTALAEFEKRYPPSPEVQAARRATAQQDLLDASLRLQSNAGSLTDVQKAQAAIHSNQFINAVESGEDQITGRLLKEQSIADPWGQATLPPNTLAEIAPALMLPPTATSPREKAQQFLQTRFEELGETIPGRYRRERILGQDPQIAEAVELYASTGDPAVLSRLSSTPSSPLTVSPRVQTELRQEEIPTGKFFGVTPNLEFADDLFEKDISLTNRISSLGAQKQSILNRLEEIDQLEPQLRVAMADETGQGGYYTKMFNSIMAEKQSLPNPDSFNVDIGDALAERNFVRNQMESLESLGPKYKMLERQEGVRPFYEVNPATNEPIPETLEIRTARAPVQLEEQKTGGGRGFAMFDPETQTKSSIGIYGIEPRNFPIADPELRPTALQREETKATLRRMPTEGPALKTYIEETQRARAATPETKQRSLQVSEALRRATIEGRDPQSILKQFGIGI
jgi:hypothetical protein